MRPPSIMTAAVLLGLVTAGSGGAQEGPILSRVLPVSDSAAAKEVLRRTRQWHDAIMRADSLELRRILLPEFTLTGAPGVDLVHVPLEQYLRTMATYQLQADRWEASDARILGEVAVVTSRYWQRATPLGQDRSGYYILTDVWKHVGSAWRAEARWAAWLDTPGGISPSVQRR